MLQTFNHISKVSGELELPGDKSISHRAVFFSSMSDGKSLVKNLANGEDVNSTISCFRNLGIEIRKEGNNAEVYGKGIRGFTKSNRPLDSGNSGTTARLITGLLSAQNFESVLTGDEFLSRRPMDRVVIPLKKMGAVIESNNNLLPLKISPAEKLEPINYQLPIPSAQIKSSVILAGLHCEGITSVIEKTPSRNHTEKMLGLDVQKSESGNTILVSSKNYPVPSEYFVPSDISTAAFFMVLAVLTKNSSLKIRNVSLNETRKGYLKILEDMGAKINYDKISVSSGEVYGDIIIESSSLKNIDIPEEIIPNIIDEIPVLSVAGIFADGSFSIRGAGELRKKESDRISSLCINYRNLGLNVEEYEDGFSLSGKIKANQIVFDSFSDHRIAMAFSILSLLLKDGGKVNNFNIVNISNPDFINQIKQIAG